MSAKVTAIVTQKIIDALEGGVAPWKQCWSSKRPRNLISGRPYTGCNALFTHPMVTGFKEAAFLTRKQAYDLGGKIKEEHKRNSIPIVFYKQAQKKDSEETYSMMRFYSVWNVEQVDGIELNSDKLREVMLNPSAENIVDTWESKPNIEIGKMDPCYMPSRDTVHVPNPGEFYSDGEFYAALFHELVHSTGHESRLARDMQPLMFDKHSYSREELIAEIGAAFLCHHAGIENVVKNQAAYCAHWLKVLGDDRKMILEAAREADKAFRMIIGEADERSQEDKTQEAA